MADANAGRDRERAAEGNGHSNGAATNDSADHDSFSELRSLLVGPERRELKALQAQLHDPSLQTRDVSRVLPDAIALRANDPQLTKALAPSVESALTASVRRDPRPLADALFPVMGPAIRKAIAHALASMMESLNRTVEHSVSWRALQWRWTAVRTGKPFAEIVLLNTLEYRVDQVFLIHAETGLLLQQVWADAGAARDADQVSAMLTAIRDFVRDSFKTRDGDTLDALRVGDLSVIVEQGPHAMLAGVVHGTPPNTLQDVFKDALERIHRQFGEELRTFSGDAGPLERARSIMEGCLVTQFRPRQQTASYRRWAAVAALVLAALGIWAFFTWRERTQWNAYVDRLRSEPGIVVASTGRRGGKFFVSGLRDALATDPATLIASTGLTPGVVEGRWEPYQSLEPRFVAERARDLLRPPPNVTLQYRDGVLTATGSAPNRWIVESERIAPAIAGVRRFEYAGANPLAQLKSAIEGLSVQFPKGGAVIAPDQSASLRAISTTLAELNDVLRVENRRARVEITGHTDTDGTDSENGPLSHARADAVLAQIHAETLDAIAFSIRGVSSEFPLTSGTAGRGQAAQSPGGVSRDDRRRSATEQPAVIQKKICMLGGFGVGKTSLVSRFVHSIFSDKYLTTVGVKIEKKSLKLGAQDVGSDRLGLARRGRLPEAPHVVPARIRRLSAGGRRHPPRDARHRAHAARESAVGHRQGARDARHQQGGSGEHLGARSGHDRSTRLSRREDERQDRHAGRRNIRGARPNHDCRLT